MVLPAMRKRGSNLKWAKNLQAFIVSIQTTYAKHIVDARHHTLCTTYSLLIVGLLFGYGLDRFRPVMPQLTTGSSCNWLQLVATICTTDRNQSCSVSVAVEGLLRVFKTGLCPVAPKKAKKPDRTRL
jgi:hypothetical protein